MPNTNGFNSNTYASKLIMLPAVKLEFCGNPTNSAKKKIYGLKSSLVKTVSLEISSKATL